MYLNKQIAFLKKIGFYWSEDKVPSFAAALAYYTLFSLGPLLVICITIGSIFLEKASVQAQILNNIDQTLGHESARQMQTIIQALTTTPADVMTTVIGIAVLIFGASGLFGQLQLSLNSIWGVKPRSGRGLMGIIKDRFLSFTMVLGVAFLLLVSMLLSIILTAISTYVSRLIPGSQGISLMPDFIISMSVQILLFAMIFKTLPDVSLKWENVWLGAFVTALLFTVGKILLGFYLSRSNGATVFGAASSLIVILIWVYYSAQILFIGAVFTKVYTLAAGDPILPTKNAILLTCTTTT